MHRRENKSKLQERRIRGFIFSNAFYDSKRSETVSLVSRVDVVSMLGEPVQLSLVPDVEKGEILVDSRGNGSFQISIGGRG